MLQRLTRVLTLLALTATPGLAQLPPASTAPATFRISPEYREVQREALEMRRRMLLAMVDSMTGAAMPAERAALRSTFAMQVRHFVDAETGIAYQWIAGRPRVTVPPDTAFMAGDRAALMAYVNRQYDFLADLLMLESETSRNERVDFLGVMKPRWQVWDEIHQRSLWSAGRIAGSLAMPMKGYTPLSVPF